MNVKRIPTFSEFAELEAQNDTIIAQTGATASAGTFSYLDDGGEQTIIEITPTKIKAIKGIWLELNNLTQDATIKFYAKIDGTNYRELTQYEYSFIVLDTDDFLFLPCDCFVNSDFKVTITEGADEGADRAIYYKLIYENLEE